MSKITITINGQTISCTEGESILQIARKEGIEIPTICYLSGCSPTMACKLCMVDIDGKRNYSCNSKAKDGMNIQTHTPEINKERNAIMQSYDINHPLQCGVCDKSGECELQNFTLKMNVTTQEYHIKESDKPHKSWAKAVYDPNLCIMCERCATTCKDNLGEAKLKAQKADLEPLDMALWKDSMPKDALSVWARKQKALIDFVSDTPCFDCGECISVCPVGALSTNDFKYKANAWELKKIESTCIHCPMGCKIIYEVRHNDTLGTPHIYRIKNDFYFNPICGAGRYGYDISSSVNPPQNLQVAIDAFKKATSINVGNQTTNEEAFVLNHLAKIHNCSLHNEEALNFKYFINAFLTYAHKTALNHLSYFKESQNVILLGSAINYEVPTLRYMLNNKLKLMKGSQAVYMHPLNENLIPSLSKNLTSIHYHPDALSVALGSLALAYIHTNPSEDAQIQTLKELIKPLLESKTTIKVPVQKEVKKTITSTNENGEEVSTEVTESIEEIQEEAVYQALLDAQISKEDFVTLSTICQNKPILVLGADVYANPQAQLLAQLLGILEHKEILQVILVPPFANALGLAMICDLSPIEQNQKKENSFSIGYRTRGDFVCESNFISIDCADFANKDSQATQNTTIGLAHHTPDFILPAINQLEGPYTSIDCRILPLKPALPFEGYDLSDIAKAFDMKGDYLIDYTSLICGCDFDDFDNRFLNDGTDMRGYRFKNLPLAPLAPLESQNLTLPSYQQYNAYMLNSPSQFNAYTARSVHLQNKVGIYVSAAFLEELGLKEGNYITLANATHQVKGAVFIDYHLNMPCFLVSPLLEGAEHIFASNAWANLHISHKESV
ncbi:MAG: NADH-quinone oxidoreductase subunit G [Helicobacter sp.]|uniref:NADH-quinone oxidoreductase subunit G n=1 Tax=Helicobacter sp. TaxID=218 RepID=UPI0025C73695|nr:NADH-quinone oxidoreductase subunit G [Helicobacter sp.]MCH5312999.1 NADH-quinone oxidoreductase subunit G [Helicobacter sp.]